MAGRRVLEGKVGDCHRVKGCIVDHCEDVEFYSGKMGATEEF